MAENIFSINTIRGIAKTPLYSNRYKVTFGESFDTSNSHITMYAHTIELPQYEINTVSLDIGGHAMGVPSKFTPGTISMTCFNSGSEYKAAYTYMKKLFEQDNHNICYFDDVKFDITIIEYNIHGDVVTTWKFTDCIMTTLSGIHLMYKESDAWEEFTMTFSVIGSTVS